MSGPAEAILGSRGTVDTVDAEGRLLTVRPPHAQDRLRLIKAVGPELGQNQLYLGMALVACSVISIDRVPVPTPTNEHQIENLVGRLGDAGMSAATGVVDRAPTDAEVREEAGNSAGTPI